MDTEAMSVRAYLAEQSKRALALLLCCTVTWTSFPAWAQVAPTPNPGGQTPGQQVAANGVPVVDIVAPNARGISHNRYSNFNVGPNGLILNNSAQISKTELGGYVAGNDNLQRSGAASLILNEVTSASSRLQGYTEIAGAKAQLVIANPNGISCDGCGFLNISRVTLTTGTPNLGSDGVLNGFSITGGALSIGSNGLDAFTVDRLDLLSRQLSVEGSIWTRELVAAAGAGRVNYDGMLLDVVPGTDGAAPSIGIDVAQLGGMYADRIRLIATEAGVGVVSRGTLAAQSGDLQIDSAGQVSLSGTTVARDEMGVRAAGDLDQRGVLGSQQGDVRLRGARMTLAGDLVAAGILDAQASGTLSHSGRSSAGAIRLFGSELNADGSLHTTGALDLGADGVLRSNGVAYAATAATLRAGQIGLTGTLQSGGAIGLNANAIDALGTLDAATALRVNSSGDARLGGLAQAGQGADVQAGGRLELQGQLIAADAVALNAANIDIAQRGVVSAGGDLELRSAGALNNAGSGYAGRDLRLQAATVTTTGSLAAARDAQAVVAGGLVNSGTFVAGIALTIDAAQLDSRGDIGSQRGETLLRSRGGLALSGNTVAGTALGLDAAADAQVSGIVNAGRVNLRSGGDAALSGTLQTTAGGLVITAGGELVSDAVVGSTGTIDLQANGALRQRGQLRGDGAVQLRGAAVEHNGVIDAGGDLRITSAAELALDGTVQSAGSATLQAGAALQNRAKVIAAGALDVEAASLRNAQSGAFSSDAGARVRTAGTLDNGGSLYAASDLQLTAGAFTQSGSASSGNTLSAAVSGSFDNAGNVIARNALQIDAGSVRSSGQLGSEAAGVRLGSQGDIALQGVVAAATTLQASAAGDLQQAGSLRAQSLALSAGRDLTAAGNLQSASTLDLQAQRALTFAAQGQAGGDASLRAATLTTSQDAVLQSTGAIALDSAAIDSRGKLDAGSDLHIRSQGDLALAGVAQGGRDVVLNAAGALSNAAQVFAGRDLSLQTASLDNTTSGVLAGEGNIALTTTALLNNAGRVQAGGDLQISAANMDQGGSASAGKALRAAIAGTLANRGNLIAKDALQVDAATLRSSGQLGSERADVTLNSRDALQLEGVVAAANALRATAGDDLQHAGSLKAQSIALQAGRDLTANGTLQSASTLDLQAQRTLALNGQASSTGEATVTGTTVLTGAAAVLQSGAAITLAGGSIDSRGSLDAATDLTVRSAGDLALAGVVQGGRDVALTAAGALNNGAQVVAARDLHVQAASANNAATATLGALRDLRVDVAGVLENKGSLHGERGLALNTGTLLQRGRVYSGDAVSISSTGAFENAGQLVAGKDLSIAADSIVSSGQLGSVNGALTLTSQNAIDLHGVVAAATTLQATAGTDLLQAGSLNAQAVTLQAGRDLTAGGTLQSASALDLQAQRSLTLNGQAQAGSDANLRGNSIATGRDAVLKSVGAISLDGAAIDSRGTLDAGTDLRLRSTGALALAGVAQANRDVVLSAADTLSNASQVIAGRDLSVQAGNINNVAAGVLAADGSVTLTTGALQNAGSLQSGGDLRITAASMDQGGTAIAGKALTAKVTGTLDNRGNLIAKDTLQVEAGSLRSSGQLGSEIANVSLISQGDMTLQGVVAAATTLQATAVGDLQQAGSLKAQSIALQAGRDLTAAGTLQSATQLDLQAQRALAMNGQAVATGNVTLRGARIGTGQAAVLQSGGAISLDGAAIDSRGALDAAADLNLRSTGDLAVAGVAQADRNVVLSAAGALTNAAQVVAGQSLNVTAASASNAASGVLLAQGDATFAIGGLLDNAGAVRAGNQLALGVGSLRQTGQAYGLQRLGVIATEAVDNRGDLIGGDGLRVEAAQVSSSGQLGSERGDVALISRGNLELGGSLASAGSFSAQADGALAQSGTLSAGSTLELRSKGDLGVAGQLGAQQVTLTSDAVLRQQGTVSGTTVGLQGARIENAGQTTASGNLSLRAGEISIAGTVGAGINADGSLGSGRTLSLIADRQLSASGKLLAGGNLTAQGSQLQLAGASTRATGNVALTTAGNLDHRGGDLLAGGTLTVQAGGNIDNGRLNAVAGQMQANQLSIDGASLSNAGGRLVQSGNGLTRVSIGGAIDNTGGTLASNAQDLTITAASLENAQGRIEHAGTGVLSVTSRSALGNSSGRILTQGQLNLDASGALNNQGGAIAAAGDAALTVAGLNNIGGSVSARGLNVQSTGAADNRNGFLQASGGALTLRADSLSNAGGIVQAVANAGAGGSLRVELNRGLDNGNGTIGAGTDAVVTAENISSSGGSLQAARDLSVTARGQLDNHQGGKLSAGRDLNVAVAGALLNSGGQLDAGNTLTASGGSIDNSQGSIVNNGGGLTRITTAGALTNSGGNLGGRGSVVIDAASIANNSGQLVAGGDLIANTNGLNNQGGNVYAGASFLLQRAGATLDNQNGTIKAEQAVRLNLQNLNNAGGKIGAGSMTGGAGDVVIDTVGFDGGGSILAQNLLDLTLRSDYTHRAGADLTSNGNFNLRVGGSLVNESTLKAARSLDITAGSITNRAGANILSNDTRLNGGNIIDNAGSISGNGALSLVANSINNTGSIVGGNVSVNTGTLVNGADFGGATDNAAYGSALLGSTGNMNLIVRDQLLNRDARIFSLGNIAIGGAQDGGGTLVSRTGVVNNLSGSIEADGSILIAANQLNNQRRVLVTGSGSGSGTAPAEEVISYGSIKMPAKGMERDPYRGKAPGVYRSYSVESGEQLVATSAEGRIIAAGNIGISGSVLNKTSTIAAANALSVNQRGVGGLADSLITTLESVDSQSLALGQTVRYTDTRVEVQGSLNSCSDSDAAWEDVCRYTVTETVIGSGTLQGNSVALNASMTGGQSVSINGANISNGAVGSDGRGISGASLNGVGAQGGLTGRAMQSAGGVGGQAVIGRANGGANSIRVATGTTGSAGTQVGANTQDATLATSGGIVKMSVAPVASNDSGLVRSSVDQADVQATAAGTGVTAVATDRRTRVDPATIPVTNIVGSGQTSLTQVDLPIGGLYRLTGGTGTDLTAMGRAANGLGGINAWRSNGPGRRYLIETDPRFVNYDNFISSDFLLDKLGVDPEWTQTRLGDGFYEQRLVLDQITQLTGRRYLGNYADGVAQYRALLESGVAAAGQLQLSMGVGLTAAQAAALTQDIVWMVEQDYQGQKVLVPVVYLASNSLQLRGNGALIAGGNVELNATNSMSNQGVIAGADVSITAGNLLNQGRISGTGAVSLEARNDLLNQGQIQGRDVALVAGNNLVSEASKAINGVGILSGISASNTLQMFAGNDMTLTGTRVQADSAALIAGNNFALTSSALYSENGAIRGGDAASIFTGTDLLVSAGNDLLLRGITLASGGSTELHAGNDLSLTTSAHNKVNGVYRGGDAGSVTTGKDLVMSAGNDLQLHGVTINAGGSAALQAGNNLSLTPTTGLDGKVATRTNISTGDSLQLTAGNDLTIRQADVKAGGDLIAAAGNNLNVESVLNETETNSYKTRNGKTRVTTTTTTQSIDQQALTAGGNLILSAGNDVNLVAAKLDAGKGLGISAGNDINASTLTTVDTSNTLETRKRFKQTTSTSDESVHGTEFSAGGNLAMQAGNDITLTAASAATKEGGITLAAGNDVNLLAASEQHDAVQDMTKKKKGTFSSKTTTTHDEWHDNVAVTTTLSGDTVQIAAGNDLLSQGAQVASTGDVVLAAGNNITLDTVQNTHSEEHEKTVKKSGLYGGGGFSVALGVTKKVDGLDVTEVTNSGSLVGSTDGSVTMTAGNKVAITGSDVLSATSTTIVGKEVTIAAAENTVDTVQTSKQQSAGLTLGLTGAAVEAAQAAYMATKRGSEAEDDRLKALYAAKTAYAVSDAVSAYQAPPTSGGQDAVSLKIALGASSASSKTTTHDETTGGSRILSDGNVTIAATGGDLNVMGSEINGQNVTLAAANNLNLLSNKETNTSKSENKNGGGEIGVSVGTTTGFYVSAYAGKGSAKGNSELHTESVVTAKDTLTLVSGNDTTIKGAQAIGDTVLAKIGGDLLIQSEQDTEDYKSKQQQAGVKLVYGVSGSSANYSQQKVNSSYTSVKEQSGIQAGNGGFDITVGGNTHLIGGAIASTADATLNHLSTGSLTVEDLQNKAEYKAGGFGVGTGDWKSVAAGAALSLGGNQTGSSGSTTKSDIAAGSVEVRNGDSTALAGLDRSATELQQSGLKQIFDEKKVAEQQELAQVAGEVAFRSAKELISYKREQAAADAEQAMADLEAAKGDPEATATAKARLLAANDQLAKWNDAGAAKQITQVTAGALAAAVSGGNVLSAAGGVLMNETLLPKFADALQKGGIQPGSGAEATLMGGLGALLGAAGGLLGGDVQAGAESGNAVQTYGYYDYREGRSQRQAMAAEALKNAGITDPNDVAGVNALLDNCVKLGCDPDKLVLLLKSPDAASTLRELAQPESFAFQRYGKGFNELDEQQRRDVINHIPTGVVSVGAIEKPPIGTVTVGAVGSTHADGTASSSSEAADNSQGIADSQQSQDENFRLKGATVVSNLAIAGGKKVEQFKNWLGEDNAETAALVLMAAAGGPVKTLGSTLWAATPIAGYFSEKKEEYLVNPLTPFIGTNAFGALTDRDQQAVQPASHATSSMLVDTLLSSLGVVGTKAGAIGIIKSSDGFLAKVEGADNAFTFSGGKPAVAGDSYHPSSVVERSKSNRDYYGEANASNEFPAGTVNYESHSTARLEQSKVPRDLNEQVLWNRVKDDPSKGEPLKLNNDPNFPREDGWQKMQVTHRLPNGNNITIHYQYNERTGKAYDMKVVTPQYD
ncbi:hemagglutinin repeat-containing protein [Xanthomonas arboricola]|uniref:Hemagglutinin repeat-containing protein n=4 Tax=Xanthomonas arboricola pv. pruni TaxID=69929 RepID=A0AAP4KBW0_9XANT|nr:hemagglutinin repeat-containing protein [Xanthomonas arboricola]MDN0267558.1 hemagglutinin repeat-containing protein [Xanthomonas arboricola pv. pruni]MDN0271837.1 hemagglutinin repeat-containing protein [Xanthomonas arboricola pv. pruni]MDN0276014.1 hemagglutinin repeat-containing protein [Xanthomonas arboricola pv. pruni]MDN0284013.1 hemagglutinin repeat-containing protein [Xanthomonas arboricola pv. pruni]MDN0288293.1 hemagglutinin repeat-containing protein [Xanthomonas arboricola pv. pr